MEVRKADGFTQIYNLRAPCVQDRPSGFLIVASLGSGVGLFTKRRLPAARLSMISSRFSTIETSATQLQPLRMLLESQMALKRSPGGDGTRVTSGFGSHN